MPDLAKVELYYFLEGKYKMLYSYIKIETVLFLYMLNTLKRVIIKIRLCIFKWQLTENVKYFNSVKNKILDRFFYKINK